MLSIQECLECVLSPFTFVTRDYPRSSVLKKYTLSDITPPQSELSELDKSVYELDETRVKKQTQNSYKGINGDQVFVLPDIDEEVQNSQSQIRNLSIQKCQNMKLIHLKSVENVYIDGCKDSFIFLGPCHSTVFIRNCKNLRVWSISQQLRVSSSSSVHIEGIVGVRPVIEDCKQIKFSSLNCKIYADLLWQIQSANIDILSNQIYQCYDFTPSKIVNFSNIASSEADSSLGLEWEARIEVNQLDWGLKGAYFPSFYHVKRSMAKKNIQDNLKLSKNSSQSSFKLLYSKSLEKEFLLNLSHQQLRNNILIVQKFDSEHCLKILKSTSEQQNIAHMMQKNGNWHFVLIKIDKSIDIQKYTKNQIRIIEDKNLIWSIYQQNNQSL